MANRLLVVQVAALGYDFLKQHDAVASVEGLVFQPTESLFPAVTCPIQAMMRTALPPSEHGLLFNGCYSRDLRRPMFWEQSSALVKGERIWKRFRDKGNTVGMLFWQQSLGEEVDLLLSPWPVHKHGGGLVDVTYAKPSGLYEELVRRTSSHFRLRHYWGPLADVKAGDWIAAATAEVMSMDMAPDLLLTYLPHLDYDLQRSAPDSRKGRKGLEALLRQLRLLATVAKANNYEVLVYGDYAMGQTKRVILPNLKLRQEGLLRVRRVGDRLYPNIHESDAFAVVDHEVAHVYVQDPRKIAQVAAALHGMGEGYHIICGEGLAVQGIAHPNCGEIVLAGEPGTWFAYPWWVSAAEAPDYATHIDIHNKPGYDPCELFFDWHPFKVSTNPGMVKGTHGIAGPNRPVAWSSTFDLGREPATLLDLAKALKERLSE